MDKITYSPEIIGGGNFAINNHRASDRKLVC